MKRQNNSGYLVISLDFELLWGVFDKVDWRDKIDYFRNTREAIPKTLALFEKYKIKSTWATVGMLFNSDWDDWNQNIPGYIPKYSNKNLSAYDFGKNIQNRESEELCFAPELIRKIGETEGQEIGTHTYSHYYCNEAGQTIEDFKDDIQKAKEKALEFGIDMKSLVFPRNQFNNTYIQICQELDLVTARSNPKNWYWQSTEKDSMKQKLFRTGDAYWGKMDKSYKFSEISTFNNFFVQPSSRFLRPNSGKSLLDKIRLKRIINEITNAAENDEIYHLWWHPHNFGSHPEKSLMELETILEHFSKCRQKYNFQSLTMGELASYHSYV